MQYTISTSNNILVGIYACVCVYKFVYNLEYIFNVTELNEMKEDIILYMISIFYNIVVCMNMYIHLYDILKYIYLERIFYNIAFTCNVPKSLQNPWRSNNI